MREVYSREDTRALAVTLGAEALAVGRALGFDAPALFGVPAEAWRASAPAAMEALKQQSESMTADGMSGTLQDLRKGRPTEVDYFNGFIASEGARLGLKVSAHAAMAAFIREVERGQRRIDVGNLEHMKGI